MSHLKVIVRKKRGERGGGGEGWCLKNIPEELVRTFFFRFFNLLVLLHLGLLNLASVCFLKKYFSQVTRIRNVVFIIFKV